MYILSSFLRNKRATYTCRADQHVRVGLGFVRVVGDTADDDNRGSCVASDLDLRKGFLLHGRGGSLKSSSPSSLALISETQLVRSRLLNYHYMRLRWGRSCWLRIYQLHQVLLLMLLLLLLLLLREASEVVEHVSRCLLLVCRGKQLDSEALVLTWNGSCWNGNSALLLLLVRLVGDVHAKLLDDPREGEGRLRGGGGDPGKLVRVHRQSRQLNLRVGDGQHVRQAKTGRCQARIIFLTNPL